MRKLLPLVILLPLNTGWVIPLFLSVSSILDWCRLEVSPLLYGTQISKNSFPFLEFPKQMLFLSCVWVAVAMAINTLMVLDRRRDVTKTLR